MSEANRFNVAIIGQGPAGMTAALYAGRAGLSTVSFERMGPGGQMTTTDALDNYPGFAEGAEPFALSFAMSAQAARFGAQAKTDEVVGLDLASTPKRIVTASGEEYAADAVILAMGAAPRPLGIPHEDELRGKGISYCATCDGGFFKDKVAVVVGGGNTAVEDAMYLANICTEVHLVHRRDTLRADAIYAKPLDELKNVTKHMSAAVDGVREEDGRVAGVLIRDRRGHGPGCKRALRRRGVSAQKRHPARYGHRAGRARLRRCGRRRQDLHSGRVRGRRRAHQAAAPGGHRRGRRRECGGIRLRVPVVRIKAV